MSAQILKILGVGAASGVAAMLILVGIVLYFIPDLKTLGIISLFFGIALLVIYGVLGIFGIIRRLR